MNQGYDGVPAMSAPLATAPSLQEGQPGLPLSYAYGKGTVPSEVVNEVIKA